MKKATISELKNRLSRYLRYVKAGESVMVVDRDTPIAHIVPLAHRPGAAGARLAALEARGIVRCGNPVRLGKFPFPEPEVTSGVLDALLADRREGR